MPPVAGPKPRPGDIGSPIPGAADAAAAAAPMPPMDMPGAKAMPAAASPAPTDSSSSASTPGSFSEYLAQQQGGGGAPAPAAPAAPAGIGSFSDYLKQQGVTGSEGNVDESARAGAPAAARAAAAIGRTPEEERRAYEAVLGAGYETTTKGDQILFRKKGESSWRETDPSIFTTFGQMYDRVKAGDVRGMMKVAWEGAQDLGKDLTADMAGMALDTAAIGGTELAGGLGAGPAGLVAGAAVAGAVQTAARTGVLGMLGVQPAVDAVKDAEFNALVNVATLGVGAALKKPLGRAVTAFRESVAQSQMGRVRTLSKIREGLEEVRTTFGVPTLQEEALGAQVESIASQQQRELATNIAMTKQQVMRAAKSSGNPVFPTEQYAGRLKEILNDYVEFDANGMARMTRETHVPVAEPTGLGPAGMEYRSTAATEVQSKALDSTRYAFGETNGKSLKEMVSMYNEVVGKGGLDAQSTFQTLDRLQVLAKFDASARPTKANAQFQRLAGALTEDRNTIVGKVLGDSPAGKADAAAWQNYTAKKEAFTTLEDSVLNQKSPEKMADAVIKPGRSDTWNAFKQVFDPASQTYENVRAAWFDGLVGRSVEKHTGIFSPQIMMKELDGYTGQMLNDLVPPEQMRRLASLERMGKSVKISDLVSSQNSAFLEHLVKATAGSVESPHNRFKVITSMFGHDQDAMAWLASPDGLLKLAAETPDAAGRSSWLKALDWIKATGASANWTVTSGGRKVTSGVPHALVAELIQATTKRQDEDPGAFATRQATSLQEIRDGYKAGVYGDAPQAVQAAQAAPAARAGTFGAAFGGGRR